MCPLLATSSTRLVLYWNIPGTLAIRISETGNKVVDSYYPVPLLKVRLRDTAKIKVCSYVRCCSRTRIPCANGPASMAKLSSSSRFVRTTQNMGQELFNMYCRQLPVGDRVSEIPNSADDQLSEYDSDFSVAMRRVAPVEKKQSWMNFLSRTVRTRTG